jgi:hypothetical protein
MDMFTSFAAAAGVPDVVERLKREKKQYIDGLNNLDYWTGKSRESARNSVLYDPAFFLVVQSSTGTLPEAVWTKIGPVLSR